MPDDEDNLPAPPEPTPEPKVATVDTTSTPVLSENALSVFDQQIADPEQLILGLRYLQQRIPQFVQLPLKERQSMTRAANLDPEFMEIGLQTADAWEGTRDFTGRDGKELQQQAEDARRWDQVERELRGLLKGVSDANLKRKHRLGRAILNVYAIVGELIETPKYAHLRGLWEQMQRVYLKTIKKARKKTAKPEDGKPK